MSKLKDERIPEFLGVINQNGFYGFILEFKPGYSVKDLLFTYKYQFTGKEVFNTGIQLINIIQYLHENKVVHGDIRIPNVLIDKGKVFLIDFGLAGWAGNHEYRYGLDFSYLGDFLLYLLYSSYGKKEKFKNLPWHQELPLTYPQKMFLKRLLGLETAYKNIDDIETDFLKAFQCKN